MMVSIDLLESLRSAPKSVLIYSDGYGHLLWYFANLEPLAWDILQKWSHHNMKCVFRIRHPSKMKPSWFKMCVSHGTSSKNECIMTQHVHFAWDIRQQWSHHNLEWAFRIRHPSIMKPSWPKLLRFVRNIIQNEPITIKNSLFAWDILQKWTHHASNCAFRMWHPPPKRHLVTA